MNLQDQLADALGRLEELEQRVQDQQHELDALKGNGAGSQGPDGDPLPFIKPDDIGPRPAGPGTPEPRTADPRSDRRTMIRNAGLAIAGAAGATAALEAATASPAAATDGSAVLAGQDNTATLPTSLTFSGGTLTTNMFTVANGSILGVAGAAIAGVAAFESPASHGVIGLTDSEFSYGVIGRGRGSGSIGVKAEGDRAALRLVPSSGDPRTSVDTHNVGEVYQDLQSNTWVCVVGGNPGTWRKIAGPATAGALHLLGTPSRVYDSRAGYPPLNVTKGMLSDGQERTVDAKNNGGVPLASIAAVINLTATNTSSAGWLSAFRSGIGWPGTSTLNWSAQNTNIANGAVVALNAQGQLTVRGAGSCDFIIDVVGYYT